MSKNITKADLVESISTQTGLTKVETKAVVEGFIDTIIETVASGKRIELRGFGVFKHKKRKPRVARNPKTGEEVQLDQRYVPVFKVSPDFFDRVNTTIKKSKGE